MAADLPGRFPSWYDWTQGEWSYEHIPLPPPWPPIPADCEAKVRVRLDEMHRDLMQHAGIRTRQPGFITLPDVQSPLDGLCDVSEMFGRCSAPAAWHIWVGCAQEHLVEGLICASHMMTLIEDEARHRWCAKCRRYNDEQLGKPEADRQPLVSDLWQVLRKVGT